MQYLLTAELLVYLFAYLFCLFVLSKEDFVLFRKNISLERVFNLALLSSLVGLLFARIFYVVFNFAHGFLNPLVFFLFPYFPGLSIPAGVLAGALFVILFTNKSKLPTQRLFDFLSLSFLASFLIRLLISMVISKLFVTYIFLILLFVVIFSLLIYFFIRAKLLDASIGYLSLITFSVFYYIIQLTRHSAFLSEDILLLGIFLFSLYTIFKQEKLWMKIKKSFLKK